MTQEAISFPNLKVGPQADAAERSYWQMVFGKLWADKLTVFAFGLMVFILSLIHI